MAITDRLTDVYCSSDTLRIDNDSKLVFISDCHRGDGGGADNLANNQNLYYVALSRYYEQGFTYIELGDGDELWENKEFSAIMSAYLNVFDLIGKFYAEGRYHMLYGNHDMVKRKSAWVKQSLSCYRVPYMAESIPLMPDLDIREGLVLSDDEHEILLLHGHQVDPLNSTFWRLARFLVRYLWRPLELIGIKDPTSASQSDKAKDKVERRLSKWCEKSGRALIAGHTHRPVFPDHGCAPYFNDGSCVHPRCVTAIELEKGALSLIKWSIGAKPDGVLYVKRDVLEGPRAVAGYFKRESGGSDEPPLRHV